MVNQPVKKACSSNTCYNNGTYSGLSGNCGCYCGSGFYGSNCMNFNASKYPVCYGDYKCVNSSSELVCPYGFY